MNFYLCNVEYRGKLNPDAIKLFKERTGKCLIGKAREARIMFSRCVQGDLSNEEVSCRISQVMDFVDIAYMVHSLVVQESPRITIEEIQDGMFHVGDLSEMDENQNRNNGYTYVLLNLCNLISKEFESFHAEKKS